MKVCLRGAINNNIRAIRGQPAWVMQFMNDCLRVILDTPPAQQAEKIKEFRELLCVDTSPLENFDTITEGK